MNRHAAILDGLGGRQYLANVLGLEVETVKKWYARGIPARHWHRILALSPELTADYLDRTKPRGVQSRLNGRRRK
jgi:hypothetical protein